MNRRSFLNLAALAIAGKAAERVFPFRVYSIPKEIVIAPNPYDGLFIGGKWSPRTPAVFGGTITSVEEEAIQRYADSHMTAAMKEFDQKLMEARFNLFHSGRFYAYDELLYPKAILPPVDWYSKV